MKKLGRFYQSLNLLSLDVMAGAIVSGLFLARILDVAVDPWGFAVLGLTVWIIYTADHLLDARALTLPAASDRHRFHQKHFRPLLYILSFTVVIDMVMISQIQKPILVAGMVLGAMVGIYLLVQRKLKSFKELCGATLYCAGVALPALSLARLPLSAFQGLVIAQFGITVLSNLLLFSLFDIKEDERDNHNSFATAMGEQKTRHFLVALFLVNGVLVLLQLLFFSDTFAFAFVMFAMNLVLFSIFTFSRAFEANGLNRLLGDAVFLVPLLFLF